MKTSEQLKPACGLINHEPGEGCADCRDWRKINPTKLYTIQGILVEATLTPGGLFYDIKIVETGSKTRYLATIFEMFAKEVKDESKEPT